MKNPKIINTITGGATYSIPQYVITDSGVEDRPPLVLYFCKGNKEDISKHRQIGVFTESLIQVAKQYLETVNVGELSTRETSMAITKLDEALMWIDKRSNDRKLREVQNTYKA